MQTATWKRKIAALNEILTSLEIIKAPEILCMLLHSSSPPPRATNPPQFISFRVSSASGPLCDIVCSPPPC